MSKHKKKCGTITIKHYLRSKAKQIIIEILLQVLTSVIIINYHVN